MDYSENKELMGYLDGVNELHSDAPDGAWFALMEAAAENYNTLFGEETFCANSAVHAWMNWTNEES